jgi:hypothetical protein
MIANVVIAAEKVICSEIAPEATKRVVRVAARSGVNRTVLVLVLDEEGRCGLGDQPAAFFLFIVDPSFTLVSGWVFDLGRGVVLKFVSSGRGTRFAEFRYLLLSS